MSEYPNLTASLIVLSGQENVITVYKAFVDFTGTLEAAMMLSQLLYWRPRSNGGWTAKSDQEFSDELCLSGYATRKARKQLEAMDILTTTIRKFAGRPVVHYRLDLEALNHKWTLWIRKVHFVDSQSGLCENAKTLIETTTTEITTKIMGANAPSPPTPPVTPDPVQEKKRLTPTQATFTALAEVCQIDLTTLTANQRGALNQSEKKLRQANAGPAELAAFSTWWYAYDWRGKRGEPPRPHQVRETWGQFTIYSNGGHDARQSTNPRAPNYRPPLATRAA